MHERFYEAVDEQCNLMLDRIAREPRMRRYEIIVKLFCIGKAPLTTAEAEAVSLHPDSRWA